TIGLTMLLASLLVAGAWITFDYYRRPRIINGPLVQMVGPDGFTVLWEVHPPHAHPLVVTLPDGEARTVLPEQRSGWCEATIDGLQAGTAYPYQIGDQWNGRGRVRTAPDADAPFRFLAFGDSGDGGRPQYRVARALACWQPDLIIHTGDLV